MMDQQSWSVFRTPLAAQFGWSIPEVTLTFTISSPAHLTIAAFLILTCYGGGFGTKLLSTFFKKDFRRGLAAMNDLVVAFGRNLSSVEKR
jgi:hypothetical protein